MKNHSSVANSYLSTLDFPNQFPTDEFPVVIGRRTLRYWYIVFDLRNVLFNLHVKPPEKLVALRGIEPLFEP